MPTTMSFEVHFLKKGNWYIDSVYDDREQALHVARDLYKNRQQKGIKVVQENYNDESDTSILRTIFTAEWGVGKPNYRRLNPNSPVRSAVRGKKKGDSGLVRYYVILVLGVGGILLTVIGLLVFLMMTVGGK